MLVLEVLNKWIDFQQICVIKQTVCVCLCLDHLRFPWFRRKSLCTSPIKQERLTSSVSSGWREETLFTLIQNISTKTKLLSMKITIGSLLFKMLKDSSGNKQKLRSIYQSIKLQMGLEIFFRNLINLSFHITSLKKILHIFTWPGHFKNQNKLSPPWGQNLLDRHPAQRHVTASRCPKSNSVAVRSLALSFFGWRFWFDFARSGYLYTCRLELGDKAMGLIS